jgi:hypothetical protein
VIVIRSHLPWTAGCKAVLGRRYYAPSVSMIRPEEFVDVEFIRPEPAAR